MTVDDLSVRCTHHWMPCIDRSSPLDWWHWHASWSRHGSWWLHWRIQRQGTALHHQLQIPLQSLWEQYVSDFELKAILHCEKSILSIRESHSCQVFIAPFFSSYFPFAFDYERLQKYERWSYFMMMHQGCLYHACVDQKKAARESLPTSVWLIKTPAVRQQFGNPAHMQVYCRFSNQSVANTLEWNTERAAGTWDCLCMTQSGDACAEQHMTRRATQQSSDEHVQIIASVWNAAGMRANEKTCANRWVDIWLQSNQAHRRWCFQMWSPLSEGQRLLLEGN